MSSVDVTFSMQSVPSFFGAPIGDIEDLSEEKIAVAGLFCDHFSAGEPGARYAARQLRYASLPLLTHGPNISPPKNIIDVGSNKGQFLLLSRIYYPFCKIFSFEPQNKYIKIQKLIEIEYPDVNFKNLRENLERGFFG